MANTLENPSDFAGFINQLVDRLQPRDQSVMPQLNRLRQDSASGLRGAIQGLDMPQGAGRNVSAAFNPGNQRFRFNQNLTNQLIQAILQNKQLNAGNRLQTLGSPAVQQSLGRKFQLEDRPSTLSTLLGNALGLGAKAFTPGLANKFLPNPQMDMFMKMFGGGGGGNTAGQGFASMDNFGFRS